MNSGGALGAEAKSALACPQCGAAAFEVGSEKFSCASCDEDYPVVGDIPCLVPDLALWRGTHLRRLDEYLWMTESRIRQWRADAALATLLPQTRDRLRTMVEAKENEHRVVSRLFADLSATSPGERSKDVPVREGALNFRLPLLECYENVFRDWAWGHAELDLCRALIERLAPPVLGGLAVYGAGAGRLALQVHERLKPALTLAFDINPLPLLAAQHLLKGEPLGLYEFPVCPTTEEHFAVHHRLEYSEEAPRDFHLLFADAKRPPFGNNALDAVLTPWFVDAVDADLRATAVGINRVLKPGGTWLNLGPLQFDTVLSRCYQLEEVHALVELSGFKLLRTLREDVPYFKSPYSGSQRVDTVFGFAAEKVSEAAPFDEPSSLAPWVSDPSAPIPVTAEVANMGRRSAFTAATLSLIDGRRSLADLAQLLAKSAGTDPRTMQEQLQAFFTKLPLN